MKRILVLALALIATGASAQEFTPEFYAGVLGGVAPTYGTVGERSPSDGTILSAGAFAGVNLMSGSTLYGLEVAATTDFGKTTVFERFQPNTTLPLPRLVSTGSCFGCTIPPGGVSRYEQSGGQAANETLNYTYLETLARPVITGRMGIRYDALTIYGKGGLGLNYQRQTDVTDQSGTTDCRAVSYETRYSGVSGGQTTQQQFATECLDPVQGSVETKTTETWTPVVVVGLGAEYDFKPAFVRGEVEMTHVLYGGSTIRAQTGVGIKF